MKNFTLLALALIANLIIYGQSVVNTGNTSNPATCDGWASVDTNAVLTWSWADSLGNEIQNGGFLIENLCQGNYILNYTNVNGTFQDSFQIVVNPCYNLATYVQTTPNTNMMGGCDGTAQVFVTGGTPPFSYTCNYISTQYYIPELCAGDYILITQDMNGCADTVYFTLVDSVVCNLPLIAESTPAAGPNDCTGTATAVADGMEPITYMWSNGATGSTATALCPGSYLVYVTDANGCTASVSVMVADSSSAGTLTASVYTTDESGSGTCDGTVFVSVQNGVPPYSYYHSTGDTTDYVTGLCDGVYSVLVVDDSGDSLVLNYLIAGPSNIIYNYTYEDSVVVDSLFNDLIINCTIDYNNVDSAFIGSAAIYASDSVTITWAIYADSTVSYVTETYYFGGGNGVYAFSVAMFCPQRSIGQYLKIYDQVYLSDALGLDENDSQAALIYPNPFTESIQCVFTEAGDFDVQLTDMTGRVVYQNQFSQTSSVTIPGLQTLASGNYMLQIAGSNGQHVYKLMK